MRKDRRRPFSFPASSLLLRCCFRGAETVRTIRDREARPSASTFTQLLSSAQWFLIQCCFTDTVTVRTIRDGEPRTSTSTFTQLPSSAESSFSVALRPQRPYGLFGTGNPGRPPQLLHSSPALLSLRSVLPYVHRDRTDYLGRGTQDVHLSFYTALQLCWFFVPFCLTDTETVRTIRDGESRTSTATLTQLLRSCSLQNLWFMDTVLSLCPSQWMNIKMALIDASLSTELFWEWQCSVRYSPPALPSGHPPPKISVPDSALSGENSALHKPV